MNTKIFFLVIVNLMTAGIIPAQNSSDMSSATVNSSASSVNTFKEPYEALINYNRTINTGSKINPLFINADLNNDGKKEFLTGNILQVSIDEYWIKNTTMKTSEGDEYSFNSFLLRNGYVLIDQVQAKYGYILVFKDGSQEIEVYLANIKGEKFSDVFIITM